MIKSTPMLLSLATLLALSGCGPKRVCDECDEVCQEVDIPLSDESFRSFFDDQTEEFDADTEVEWGQVREDAPPAGADFTWVQDIENADGFKTVYFDFDSSKVSSEQEAVVAYNIELAKAKLAECPDYRPTIVVEGHACHSAGKPWYNLTKSEDRAKMLRDRFVEAGIPAECIKIVGRGDQMPAVVDGIEVNGDRVAQAPNRRDEIRAIYA